jgi:hypothetical protein
MKKLLNALIITILLLSANGLKGQGNEMAPSFPSGAPILRIFANVYSGVTDADPSRAFEVRRAYLGYKYQFDPHFSTEMKLDIGSPDDVSEFSRIRRYAYFKTAALYWEKDRWTLKGGIIDTEHYRRQEKYWKHRYIYKSFQDEYRFGPKADLGATILFRAMDQLELDASLMNGEGYKNLQRDEAFKGSLGISWYPLDRILLRIYYDFINQDLWQTTVSTFAAYRLDRITAGAEYNRKGNTDFNQDHHQNGISAYLSYDINDRFEVFGRYDMLRSNQLPEQNQPWNLADDGSAIIGGVQYMPIRHVKLALNYQDWVPYAANLGNRRYIFLNLEVVL